MNHHLISVGLLAAFSTFACKGAEPSSCDVVVSSSRGVVIGGTDLHAASLGRGIHENQGTSFNGIDRQGVELQGVALNGAALDGGVIDGAELVGTALRATDSTGRSIAGADLIGARLIGRVADHHIELRIASAENDGAVEWYELEHEGEPLCGADGRGLFVRGVWDETGSRHDALAEDPSIAFTFSCAAGVIAKCVAWGYVPDQVGIDAHQTCTRLARADYCGDGQAHTVDGTLVDVFDTLGVMQPAPGADLEFEAGWGPRGATCVSRPRFVELDEAGRELTIPCWSALPACDDADQAIAAGATLMNRSAPQTLCRAP